MKKYDSTREKKNCIINSAILCLSISSNLQQKRTCLHIAALLGDDGIIRTLLKHGANPLCADTEGNIPAHLAAKWCSREENYADYKLVMTPLVQVF